MSELRAVAHNVWVGQHPDALRKNLERLAQATDRPHVMALQEAKRLRHPIEGYQRLAIAEPEHPDDAGMQLLVREDLEVVRARLLPVGGPWWTGPHGDRHPPKIFLGATVEHRGRRWDLLSVHRCWTGPKHRNRDTWEAEHAALRAWIKARATRDHGTRPVVPLGDWNGRASDTGPTSITRLAAEVGGDLRMSGIDGALGVNVTALTVRELPRLFGSDGHRPIVCEAVTPSFTN